LISLLRQAEFLHGVAVINEGFSGIDHWWIGLTDLGRFGKLTIIYGFKHN